MTDNLSSVLSCPSSTSKRVDTTAIHSTINFQSMLRGSTDARLAGSSFNISLVEAVPLIFGYGQKFNLITEQFSCKLQTKKKKKKEISVGPRYA